MAKTKLRWEFPPKKEMHEIKVHDIYNIGLNHHITVLRPCVNGYDEQGILRKTLYCTRDGRFFARSPKRHGGWSPQKECFSPSGQCRTHDSCYPTMRHFGCKHCHHLVAHAWLRARPAGKECDHINGDKLNWRAENLQWVTPKENRRRAKIMQRLRKMGIDPRRVLIPRLKEIYKLPARRLERFFEHLPVCFANDCNPLTIERINSDIRDALHACLINR